MVFSTIVNYAQRLCLGNRGPDRFWKRRRAFSLAGVSKLNSNKLYPIDESSGTDAEIKGLSYEVRYLQGQCAFRTAVAIINDPVVEKPIKNHYFHALNHLYGRHRNCYKFALRGVLKTLKKATIGRKFKKHDTRKLQELRIDSAANEHGIARWQLVEGIQRCLILLSRRSLADLAIWEPRTFKALTDVAKTKIQLENELSYEGMKADDVGHFIRKDLLRENK